MVDSSIVISISNSCKLCRFFSIVTVVVFSVVDSIAWSSKLLPHWAPLLSKPPSSWAWCICSSWVENYSASTYSTYPIIPSSHRPIVPSSTWDFLQPIHQLVHFRASQLGAEASAEAGDIAAEVAGASSAMSAPDKSDPHENVTQKKTIHFGVTIHFLEVGFSKMANIIEVGKVHPAQSWGGWSLARLPKLTSFTRSVVLRDPSKSINNQSLEGSCQTAACPTSKDSGADGCCLMLIAIPLQVASKFNLAIQNSNWCYLDAST